jgi:hypothetical protein
VVNNRNGDSKVIRQVARHRPLPRQIIGKIEIDTIHSPARETDQKRGRFNRIRHVQVGCEHLDTCRTKSAYIEL